MVSAPLKNWLATISPGYLYPHYPLGTGSQPNVSGSICASAAKHLQHPVVMGLEPEIMERYASCWLMAAVCIAIPAKTCKVYDA